MSDKLIEKIDLDLSNKDDNDSDEYDNHQYNYQEANEISNDNIIYQNDDNLIENESEIGKPTSYCGIKGDSQLGVILNIISSAIGGGCFNFPYILYESGLPISLIIFILSTLSMYYSLDLLRSFVIDTKFFSFSLITLKTLGKKWLYIFVFSSFIFYSVVEINYLSLLYSYFVEIISSFIDKGNALFFFKILFLFVTLILEIILCLYISKVQKLHLISLISVISFFLILFALVFESSRNVINNEKQKFSYEKFIFPYSKNDFSLLNFFSIFSYLIEFLYGYSCHSSFPTLIGNLENISEECSKKVQIVSFSSIFFSYAIITLFGYLFTDKVPEILFLSDNKTRQEEMKLPILFRIFLCVFLFTLIPSRFLVIKDNYSSVFSKNILGMRFELILISICFLLYNVIVYLTSEYKIGFNFISSFMQLFGGIFGVIICFLLPVINYTAIHGTRKARTIIGFCFLGIFCLAGVISVGFSVHNIVTDEN